MPFVLVRRAANLAEEALEANGDDFNTYIPYRGCLFRAGRPAEARSVGTLMNEVLRKQLETVPEGCRAIKPKHYLIDKVGDNGAEGES